LSEQINEALSRCAYIVYTHVSPAEEVEFVRRQTDEQIPRMLEVPGVLRAARYVALEGTTSGRNSPIVSSPKYMTLFDVVSSAAAGEAERALGASDWSRALASRVTVDAISYSQIFPFTGMFKGEAWGDGQTPVGALLAIREDIDPEEEDEFNAWDHGEHIPLVCAVPGVIGCRRLRTTTTGSPKYSTLYYTTDHAVAGTEAWGAPRNTKLMPINGPRITTLWRCWYSPLGRPVQAAT